MVNIYDDPDKDILLDFSPGIHLDVWQNRETLTKPMDFFSCFSLTKLLLILLSIQIPMQIL